MTEIFGIWDKIWQNGKETALSQCQQASYSFLSFSPTCQKSSKYSNPLTFLHSLFASVWLAFYGMGLPMSFPDKWRVNTTSKSSSYIELFRWKPMTFPFPQCLLLPRMPQQHQTTQLSLHDLVFFRSETATSWRLPCHGVFLLANHPHRPGLRPQLVGGCIEMLA